MAEPDPRTVAVRLCKALSVDVGGKPGMWRSLALIASRARIRSQVERDRSIAYARAQGWLEVDDERGVCLTDEGARMKWH